MKFNPAASCRFIRNSLYSQPLYLRIGISLLLLITVSLFQSLLINYGNFKTPFLLYFGVVIISAIFCGKIPASITACCSAIIDIWFFFQPADSFNNLIASLFQISLYLLECFAFIYLNYRHAEVSNKTTNEFFFKNVIDKNAPAIAIIDKTGKPLYISSSVEKLVGYTSEEIITLNYNLLYNKEDQFKIKEHFKNILTAKEKQASFSYQYRHKNGSYVWIECLVTNYIDEPSIQAVLINFKNITDKIIAAEKKDEFVKIASHELAAPLDVLKGYTTLIKDEAVKADNVRMENIVERIEMQLKKMNLLLKNLSDANKVENTSTFSYSCFDINDLVLETINNSKHFNGATHIINTHLSSSGRVMANRSRISEVINNLISNAINFSPKGNMIKVVSKPEPHGLRLEVIDQGEGIDKEDQSKLFSRFYKGNKALVNQGLGLYTAAQIIREHGGNIGFESEKGKGSVFWFTLPAEN